eukprot:363630-Chlamydomonas_euryale.AAC.8
MTTPADRRRDMVHEDGGPPAMHSSYREVHGAYGHKNVFWLSIDAWENERRRYDVTENYVAKLFRLMSSRCVNSIDRVIL